MHQTTVLFNNVALLAKRLGKHIATYDLECTTFRGRPNFGITELSCFFVSPEGQSAIVGSLINPERQIDTRVVELTGITNSMVADKETWGTRYAKMFANMAKGECWVTGFNNATFDNPAVIEMNARYGTPIDAFQYSFDVRTLHLKLSQAKSTAGKLAGVASDYGVFPRGQLHRAQADVALTVELLNAIIGRYGLEAVAALIEANPAVVSALVKPRPATAVKPVTPRTGYTAADAASPVSKHRAPAKDKPATAALIEYVQGKTFVSMQMLAEALGLEERTISFEIGKAIDEGTVDPFTFAVAPAQEWLTQELVEMDAAVLTQGKLKPIYDALASGAPQGHLDYVQLRIALLAAGQSWGTLKRQ